MDRLYNYFYSAHTTDGGSRTFGIEIETLFVDRVTRSPIDERCSQLLMSHLAGTGEWKPKGISNGYILEMAVNGFVLKYDVGFNLLEITTPTALVSRKEALFTRLGERLEELYSAAASVNAEGVTSHCDGSTAATIVLRSTNNFLDFYLNGESIANLTHIAAVHYNIDLESVEQGFTWMHKLTSYFKNRDWPPSESRHYWEAFLAGSPARYEPERYGASPEPDDYLRTLARLKVYKNRVTSEPFLENPPRQFYKCQQVDIEEFLASVWWWSRLRVRNGRLVLEIRAVPRNNDERLRTDFEDILRFLGILVVYS